MTSFTRFKIIGAFLILTLIPCVVFGSFGAAYVLAQAGPVETGKEIVEGLANKSLSYWFIALAVVAITSWSFMAKWLINQLELQRDANSILTNKLIGYMEKDHTAMVQVVTEVAAVQKQTASILERAIRRLDAKESPSG